MSLLTGILIAAGAIYLILNVTAVIVGRKREMFAPRRKIDTVLHLVILPTIILIYIAWFFITIIPRPLSKEEKAFRDRERAHKKEIAGLTEDEIRFRNGRKFLNLHLDQFDQELLVLDPKAPSWSLDMKEDRLPHGANVLLEILIEASADLASLKGAPSYDKEDLATEQNLLEDCYKKMHSILVEHVDLGEERAAQFIVDEVSYFMMEDDFHRKESVPLSNPAYDYFYETQKQDGPLGYI